MKDCSGDDDGNAGRSLSISQHGNFLSPPAFCTDLSLVPTFPVAHNPLLPSFSLLQNNDKFQSIWTATIQMISASQLKTMINIKWQIVVPCIAECPTINCCRKGSLQCRMEQCTMAKWNNAQCRMEQCHIQSTSKFRNNFVKKDSTKGALIITDLYFW